MAALLLGSSFMAFGQSYDDDDIYFNPSKSKEQPKKQPKQSGNYTVYDYPAADTYVPGTGNTNIDVDAYNRRGVFAPADSTARRQNSTDFNYTRQIERFHNPDVVTQSNDPDAVSLYYSQPATNVNIIVQNDPFDYWGSPYYGSSLYWGYPRYAWNWGWGGYWGPSWSWGGYWGPSWSWGGYWGPSWSWGGYWGPSWGWGGYWGPSWGWTVPSRPNRPVGNVRPGYGSRPSGNYRHGSTGYRPGYSTGGNYRPGTRNSGYRQSTRPSTRSGNSNYRPSTRSSNNNNNYNYNRSYDTHRNSSFGTSSGGYRGGSGSFGGGRSGGGTGRGRH